jgi:S-adenosylmethionine-dependent methyltransferase
MDDVYFDSRAGRFQQNIYNSPKGQLRLMLLRDDLQQFLGADETLDVLDAGGGLGQMSLLFARAGHRVSYCEPALNMCEQARANFQSAGVEDRIELINAPVQTLFDSGRSFDLVICHAVLEWLGRPQQVLQQIIKLIRDNGHLSLMYFNVHSIILRNLLRGNFRKAISGDFKGDPGSMTPLNPLEPEMVMLWLKDSGMHIELETGIRSFSDYLSREHRERTGIEELYDLERRFARQEPYLRMARYIHVLARKCPSVNS